MPNGILALDATGLEDSNQSLVLCAVLWPDNVAPVPPKEDVIKWIRQTALGFAYIKLSVEHRHALKRLPAAAIVMRRCLERAEVRHGPCSYRLTRSTKLHSLAAALSEHQKGKHDS
jgi:hypothetical protein